MNNKKRGFTLIELIAVLIILATIFMIVTPLVLNIIRKAKVSADKRSVDAYARSIEIGVAKYLLDNVDFPDEFEDIDIEYRGEEVKCANVAVNNDGSVYLDKCTVGGRIVKDSSSASGYYTVGRATSNYMFYRIQNIEIENIDHNVNGNEVSGGLTPSGTVNYNGVLYYEVPNVVVDGTYRMLIKATPLSYDEVLSYSDGTYSVDNLDGIGVVPFYSSSTCKENDISGCNADYENSIVKKIVDAWARNKSNDNYALITVDNLLKAGFKINGTSIDITDNVTESFYRIEIPYWTMTKVEGSNNLVYAGALKFTGNFVYTKAAVRPVVVIDNDILQSLKNKSKDNKTSGSIEKNSVNPNTVDKIVMYVASLVLIVCLIILIIYLINKNNKKDKK